MATMQAELTTIWTTYVVANYGATGSTARTKITGAIDTVHWVPVPTGDPIVDLLAQVMTNVRTPSSPGWLLDLTAAQKKALYHEVDAALSQVKVVVDAVYTALDAAYTALP